MNREQPRGTWAWPPLVPRPILAVAWAGFNGITALAIAIDLIQAPAGMPVGDIVWEAIGGDASGVCYWALLGSYLYSEVITMILTKWANQARVEQAREQARAEARAETEQARAEARAETEQALEQGRAETEQALEQARAEGRAEARWRGRRRARAEDRRRGRAEENRRWREYLDRRAAAERAGLPFNEPMPEPPDPFQDES